MDMQKQQQIEELIGIIQGAVGGCATHWASLIAEEVLKYYQPKIPENAVVLTKEEYKALKEQIEYWEYETKVARQELFEERKETIEKFAERLKEVVNGDINRMYALRIDGVAPLCRFIEQIDEICKEITGVK